MNKRLLVGLFSAFMAMAPWCGNAAETQNIDAPHLNLTDGCENCHFAGLEPGDCTVRCHTSNVPPYNDTVAPIAVTHQGLACQACHNPHVSLQTGGIAGAFTGVTYDAPSDRSTLTGVSPTPDPLWAAKTSAERGMILWVPDGVENASYEVKAIDATAGTVTVKGNITTVSRTFELRRGQLIAKAVTKTVGESYKVGTIAVQFPASATQPFVDTTNNNGICQVCHTAYDAATNPTGTTHWSSDGLGTDHNPTQVCTSCHRHDSGFLVTGCNACHQGVGEDGVPVDLPGMAVPSTNSVTAGQHQVHAVDYAFPCATCHVGTGMDRINDPLHPVADGKIQIGFNWGKYLGWLTTYDGQASVVYEGTNHTTVTNGGTMTCGTVYCHSNGVPVRLNCATSTTNTTPKWDGSSADPQADTVKCNNCHGFQNTSGAQNVITSGKHLLHVSSIKIGCYVCHAGTAQLVGGATPGANITGLSELLPNKGNHANAAYDIMGSGLYNGLPIVLDSTLAAGAPGKWDPVTKTCVTLCHSPANRTSNNTWTANDTATCPDPCAEPGAMTNLDPAIAWQTQNIDGNTVLLTDVSDDPDRNDLVKNRCQGGGFDGSMGLLKVQAANDTKLGNLAPSAYLAGATQPTAPVVHTFRSTATVDSDGALTVPPVLDLADPAQPKAWWFYVVADNGPLSRGRINRTSDLPDDGIVRSGWFSHTMTSVDMATTNANPILDFVVPTATNGGLVRTGPNTVRFTWTNRTIDPDAIDVNKNTLFGAGHDGSVGRQRLWFLNPADAQAGAGAILSATYTSTAPPVDGTIAYDVYGPPGYLLWYQVQVRDNHYVAIPADREKKSYTISSGWLYVTLP